jgi:hypothetical protein
MAEVVRESEEQITVETKPETPDEPQVPTLVSESISGPKESPRVFSHERGGVTFTVVTFDSRSHRLHVSDFTGGPRDGLTAESAAKTMGGIAAVNGGFFTPTGEPLGMVVSGGEVRGAWNAASSLGSGLWLETREGHMSIRRRAGMTTASARSMRELIQAGPLLVENAKAVAGLESEKTSARSFVLWDGDTRWAIGHCSPCSLKETAGLLASAAPVPWRVRLALNLDGGRSADLWADASLPGGPVTMRSFLNRPVRNYLVLVAR